AEGPAPDVVGAGQADLDGAIVIDTIVSALAHAHETLSSAITLLGAVAGSRRVSGADAATRPPPRLSIPRPVPAHDRCVWPGMASFVMMDRWFRDEPTGPVSGAGPGTGRRRYRPADRRVAPDASSRPESARSTLEGVARSSGPMPLS